MTNGFLERKNEFNPDVLSCLASLSNDEVFTPPGVANKMLDMLPQELFRDPKATFLDPACKTGVFLREIAKRLMRGLADAIPDEAERREHIFRKQLFGIAITELTALMSRRSVYCSKNASGKYSVVKFDKPDGNIVFHEKYHKWKNGKCIHCGASRKANSNRDGRETYAYEFIHVTSIKDIFDMDFSFDVIIGNPPYQLEDGGGGSSATPIYHKFIEKAINLNPRFLVMIIPSRWMTGGKGLDLFRKSMIGDTHIEILHDFVKSSDCFSGVNIEAGVCYFKRSLAYDGPCIFVSHQSDGGIVESKRYLSDGNGEVIIRDAQVMSIIAKVKSRNEKSFSSIVSKRNPFNIKGKTEYLIAEENTSRKILCLHNRNRKFAFLREDVLIDRNQEQIAQYKIFLSKADGAAGQLGNPIPARIIGKPEIGEPGTLCSETFLCVAASGQEEAKNIARYIKTKFFRFMVGIRKNKNMTHETFSFVPMQDFSKAWTDEELYAKYGLTAEERAFIESMIRPMEV